MLLLLVLLLGHCILNILVCRRQLLILWVRPEIVGRLHIDVVQLGEGVLLLMLFRDVKLLLHEVCMSILLLSIYRKYGMTLLLHLLFDTQNLRASHESWLLRNLLLLHQLLRLIVDVLNWLADLGEIAYTGTVVGWKCNLKVSGDLLLVILSTTLINISAFSSHPERSPRAIWWIVVLQIVLHVLLL